MPPPPDRLPHLTRRDTPTVEPFTSAQEGRSHSRIPPRDRSGHATRLRDQLELARAQAQAAAARRTAIGIEIEGGLWLEFQSEPEFDLALKSLDAAKQGIELTSVRIVDQVTD